MSEALSSAIIAIAGPSGSGKSLLAMSLQAVLGRDQCVVIPMDHFYRDRSGLSVAARNQINFDKPDALDVDLIRATLSTLLAGNAAVLPHYDFASHSRTEMGSVVKPAPLLIVEGIFALALEPIGIRYRQSWYVDLDADSCLERRLQRDAHERGRDTSEIQQRFERDVRPSMQRWVEPQLKLADCVFDGKSALASLLKQALDQLHALDLVDMNDCPLDPRDVAKLPKDILPIASRIGMDVLTKRRHKQMDPLQFTPKGSCERNYLERKMRRNQRIRSMLRYTGMSSLGCRFASALALVRNTIRLGSLPSALDGFKLLHLSDLHADLDAGALERLPGLIAGESYQLVVITGDFGNNTQPEPLKTLQKLLPLLAILKAPVIAVLGNHDPIELVPSLEKHGVRVLLNEAIVIRHGTGRLWLGGVDDPYFFRSDRTDLTSPDKSDGNTLSILLAHSPGIYRQAIGKFDLLLAGHTHGGQVCLPGGIPIIRNGNCPSRMLSGSWCEQDLQGYTSRGVGCSGAFIRFFCPPEMTLHTLRRDIK
jgi:uridine kinase/predicted MPP superfamily phosphohydrolase